MKLDIILQGPIYPETTEIVKNYLSLPFVSKIIISTWKNQPNIQIENQNIIEIRSSDVTNPGPGNINRQIISSQRGFALAEEEIAVKMRTDQIISVNSMHKMNAYFQKHCAKDDREFDYDSCSFLPSPIFVLGMYRDFLFHPRDHVFWGYREDLKNLFSLPLYELPENKNPKGSDLYWSNMVRPETWIGVHYYYKILGYRNLNNRETIINFLKDPVNYLTDQSSKHNEAMAFYSNHRESAFKPFPKIEMRWPKHGLEEYHYHVGAKLSEYWAENE